MSGTHTHTLIYMCTHLLQPSQPLSLSVTLYLCLSLPQKTTWSFSRFFCHNITPHVTAALVHTKKREEENMEERRQKKKFPIFINHMQLNDSNVFMTSSFTAPCASLSLGCWSCFSLTVQQTPWGHTLFLITFVVAALEVKCWRQNQQKSHLDN